MSELDAYRDVLKNVDEIKKMLDSLPITEDEQRGRQNRDSYKDNAKVIDKISSALWLLVVFVYLAFSLRSAAGGIHGSSSYGVPLVRRL